METNTSLKRVRSGSDTVNPEENHTKKLTKPTEPEAETLKFESKDSQILFQEIQNMAQRLRSIKTTTTATDASVKGMVASLQVDMDELKKAKDDNHQTVTKLQSKLAETQVGYEKEKKHAKYERLRLEMYRCKFNLILEGLPEGGQRENPTSLKRVIYKFCSADLKVENPDIDVVHRLGAFNPNKSRPTLIRFKGLEDRQAVWNARKLLKQAGKNPREYLYLREDILGEAKKILDVLYRSLHAARSTNEFKDASVRDFKLYIRGLAYR